MLRDDLISDEKDFPSNAAKIRYSIVEAAISAWSSVCTPHMCSRAAFFAGVVPWNPTNLLHGFFVHELTPKEREIHERRQAYLALHYTIGNKVITDGHQVAQIVDKLRTTGKFDHLFTPIFDENGMASYQNLYKYYCTNCFHNARMLSSPPPYYKEGEAPIFF